MTLVITIALPYALAAMCGALTERSGVIDLALEAKLLFGAFAAAALAHATGSPCTTTGFGRFIEAWPVHETGWRREILRMEVDEYCDMWNPYA